MDEFMNMVDKLSNYFVRVDKCTEIQSDNKNRFYKDETQLKLFEQKMDQWSFIFKIIASGTIGTLVTSVLALVLKVV